MSIVLDHVSKSFARKSEVGGTRTSQDRRIVLRDLCLEVRESEIVFVIGRNGSGKTTLTRILSTLIEPDSGEATVCGFDVVKEAREVRSRVGVMMNAGEGGFDARLSGCSNLQFYATLYRIPLKESRIRIESILKAVGLHDRGADQFQSYSSGMRRRLALARALLPDPNVLLLDEPTLGIDPWSTKQIHENLAQLSRDGKTVFCATNNLGEARALTDRIYRLEEGVVSEWSLKEVEVA